MTELLFSKNEVILMVFDMLEVKKDRVKEIKDIESKRGVINE